LSTLGGEPPLLDPQDEERGVEEMLKALTEEERALLADESMAIRHFRAEKVTRSVKQWFYDCFSLILHAFLFTQGVLVKAIASLKATLKWRQEFEVDRIKRCMESDDDEEMKAIMMQENETGKIYVRGYDAQGRALLYMRPARENTNNEHNNMRHLVWNLEKAIACTRRKSMELGAIPPLEKINLVIDYDDFKLKNAPPLSTSRLTLDILQKHYPERMYRAYCLNPPMVFRTFWAIIRPFVDPVTKEKIVFCSGKSGMAKLTDAVKQLDKLEECAGGTSEVRDFDSKEYLQLSFDQSFDE